MLFSFLLCLFATAGVAFAKDKESLQKPPPLAKPGVVSVYLGQPLEIDLNIGGRIVEPVTFLIRKPPRQGVLGELRRTSRTTASVLYSPDPDAAAGGDSFSFAAKSVDSPVSAAGTVQIRLIEEPALVDFPKEVDFGALFLGDTVERDVPVRNSGGGVASWKVRTNPPWSIRGPDTYSVSATKEAVLHLVFAPAEERDFLDSVQMAPDPKSILRVSGSGVSPISWSSAGVVFSPEQREKGAAEIVLTNRTPGERSLEVDWPDFLKARKMISLPGGESAAVQIEVDAPPAFHFQGDINIRSGNFHSTIPIRIFPSPAKLVTSPEKTLTLGKIQKEGLWKASFVVRNIGGADAPIQITAPPEILVVPDPRSLILGSGEEQAFEAQLQNSKPARYSGTVRIESPACKPLELSIEAPGSAPGKASLPVGNFLNLPQTLEAGRDPAPAIDQVSRTGKATLLSSTPHEVVLSWKLATRGTKTFKLERRSVSSGADDRVLIQWIPWQGAQISVNDDAVIARLVRLPANTLWTVRLVPLDENGQPGPPSPPFQISTQPLEKHSVPLWAWLAIFLVFVAVGVHFWRRYQVLLHSRANARIERLGGR